MSDVSISAERIPVESFTSPVPSIWRRLLHPSLSDLFFLFITVWMFLSSPVGWQRLLLDADTALHTRIGQYILSTGSIPHVDLFSFSKPGQTWYAFEWLSETILAACYGLAGYKGIVLLAGMMIALFVTILFKYTLWKGANGLIALVLTLLAATATSVHFHARPHLFTLLFLTIAIWLMEAHRRNGGKAIWLLVPMSVLWVNLHGGVFIFFALLGLRFLGCVAEAYFWPAIRAERKKEAIELAALGTASGIASVLNPYGINLQLHIVEILSSDWIMTHVHEFMSPSFRGEQLMDFMILLITGLACIVPLIRRRNLVETLWILFLAYCSLRSSRHLTIFVLAAAPVIALVLSEYWSTIAANKPKASVLGLLNDFSRQLTTWSTGTSLFIPATILILAHVPGMHWPTTFPDTEGLPVTLIQKNADLLADSRVFASDQIADYLIFRNYPKQRVFFDSRHNYYGDKIGDEYLAIAEGGTEWNRLLEQYDIGVLLCKIGSPLDSLVTAAGGWYVVDSDDKFRLWEKTR